MADRGFFFDLMHSLDSAFLALQGIGPWHPEGWGERFFQALILNHPEWAGRRIQVYMKASELLNHFVFRSRAEEMGPAFYDNPESLLRTVLILMHHGERDRPALKRHSSSVYRQ